MKYRISESTRADKKLMVYPVDSRGNKIGKVVHFGQKGFQDYTIHRDDQRKAHYMSRHQHDNIFDLESAGSWAWFILWNKPTIRASARDMENKFNIQIEFDLIV